MNYPGRDGANVMTPDHYATLQVSRRSEDMVIRAAYLALMRRYHPDTNPSADAAARTRAINVAYAVLGDPHRRAEYDQMRSRAMWTEPPPRRALSWLPMSAAIAAIGLLTVIPMMIDWTPQTGRGAIDRLQPVERRASTAIVANPAAICALPAAYDRIKQDLFRQAARVRGSDEALFARMAGYAVLRVEPPTLAGNQSEPDTISCRAAVALDLPPGVVTSEGRRTLSGPVAFSMPNAGGPSALVLSDGGTIVPRLATLARVAAPDDAAQVTQDAVAEPSPSIPPEAAPVRPRIPPFAAEPMPPRTPPSPPVAKATPPAVAKTASAKPAPVKSRSGFSCDFSGGGNVASCGSSDLTRLDRRQNLLYTQSWGSANESKRGQLASTRDSFAARRNACRSDACVSQAYLARMREITDIMAGYWKKPR